MQPSDMDRKREAFLEHLKQKYPHHASAIMGHQERLREQSRSPKHCASPQAAAADPAEHLCVASLDALELMSEGDGPSAFTRGSRSRASLPVVRSANQTKDRSLGVLYLQYGDETKAMRMPNEITGSDTIRALFVSAFPQHLNMKMLESPSVAIYMKDDVRNVYYELSDVRNITDHSCLKVYHKDPAQAFNHGSRPANGDARVHREALYGGREGQHSLRQPPLGSPAHGMASPLSPPPPLSMPPSPSRIPFGPRGATLPGGATLPRDRLAMRQSFRKEGMETLVKARGGMASPVTPDLPPGSPNDPQTRCSFLSVLSHAGASPILSARSSAALLESTSTPPPSSGPAPLQASLAHFRRSVADLRQQLQQMRQLQIQNQETLKLMLKQAEQEIGHKVADTLKRLEDPVQKQRALVEEERQKYLGMEERVLEQLGELELLVEELKKERVVTLKDVEDRAVSLQKVGDGLAELKGEFPALQTKMRAVLRVEVEAVRFLKEEPHKLDSILKRVKTLTEALGCLRRSATEGLLKGLEPVEADNPVAAETVPPRADSPPIALPEPHSSIVRTEVMPASPLVVQRAQSSPVHLQQSQQSAEPTAASLERPLSSPEPPAPSTQALFIEEIHTSREKSQQRALSIEAAEREWEEKRQNMTHYDGKEFEKVLQEAQANMMKGFPSFEATAEGEGSPAPPLTTAPQPESEANRPAPPPSEKPQKPPTEPKPPAEKLPRPGAAKAARLEAEKAGKSPPPPPPRRSYPPGSGLTTGRSGEVIFTSRKESVTMQEGEEVSPAQKSKPKARSPTESGPKLPTPAAPPSVVASAVPEEEDEGNKIMAELQVFQKCALKDVGLKRFVEPQVRELRAGALISPRERKVNSTVRFSLPPPRCLLQLAAI
uniref:KIAA1217 n=1 Tax=Scleropages formosus TaxID=113540 RepID=A0A8C9R4C4_SCLFO